MKIKYIFPTLAFLILGSSYTAEAQTSDKRWMAGLSAIFLDYQGPINGNYTDVKNFDPGLSLSASAYVNNFLNVSLNSSFVPETSYPLSQENFISTSLIDVNALAHFKSNGTIFSEHSFFAPFIATGFGLNSASNNIRYYIPASLGIRLKINPNFSFQIQSTYKQSLGKDKFQHIAHSAGFVFALPSEKKYTPPPSKKKKTQEKEKEVLAKNLDSDGDGIEDAKDRCPNQPGTIMYLGCPEEEVKDNSEAETVIADANESTQNENAGSYDSYDNGDSSFEKETAGSSYEGDAYAETANSGPDMSPADLQTFGDALENVYFEPGSNEIAAESYEVLDIVADMLEKYPKYGLNVLGHTDNTGGDQANQVLSVMRAFEVKYYLVYKKGISMSRIASDGYSSTLPVADNSSWDGRSKNRRVEFRLVSAKATQSPQAF